MNFVIITGVSGAGKSQAANILEDMGYYCIDNMPALMIEQFAEIYSQSPVNMTGVVFIVDVRGEAEFQTLLDRTDMLKRNGHRCILLFMECENSVIITRYKETRRKHPLSAKKNIPITEALALERSILEQAKENADYIIDTSKISVKQLAAKLGAIMKTDMKREIVITCASFGFKYGIPSEADTVFDVRCFPNPFYIDELKNKTGLDEEVRNFVLASENLQEFLQKLYDMMKFLLPMYKDEGKFQIYIGIGCTGGKHRSVVVTECLNNYLQSLGYNSIALHRDILK